MIKLYTFGKKNLIFDSILKDTCVENDNDSDCLLRSYQIDGGVDKIINDIVCTNDTILILFSNGDILCKRLISTVPNIIYNEIQFNFIVDKISSGFNHIHIITNDNRVFGIGDNSFNQIGLTHSNTCTNWYDTFQAVEYFNLDSNITITSISSGTRHTIFHDCKSNFLYTCGSNKYGQLGKPVTDDNMAVHDIGILQFENIGEILKIKSGDNHNLIINSIGKVFAFGCNSYGQLGIENEDNLINIEIPTMLEFDEGGDEDVFIVDGKCSNWHSLLLSNDGRVFSFGNGSSYQLGTGDNDSSNVPIELDEDFIVKEISCSMHSSLFLDTENRIFYCGESLSYNKDDMIKYPTSISQIINKHIINFIPNKVYSHNSNFNFIW